MINTLWTSATGMRAQQFNIDTIANNLTIVSIITGFEKSENWAGYYTFPLAFASFV